MKECTPITAVTKTFPYTHKSKTVTASQKQSRLNPLSGNPTKLSNTLKQFVGNLPTNYLSVFDHFVELVVKGLTWGHAITAQNSQSSALEYINGDFDSTSKNGKPNTAAINQGAMHKIL